MGSLINIAKPLWFSSLSLDKKIMLAIYDKQSEKINTYIDDPIFESDSGSYKIKMLLYAYEDENNTMISLLKNKKGIEINSCDQTGKTALHYAALDANRQLVEILLKNGADITMVDKRGETALHFAVKSKNRENRKLATIEKLLEYNVPFENKNIENKSAYDIAKEKSLDDIVKLLKNKQP